MKKKTKKKKQLQHHKDTSPQSTFFLSFVGEMVEIMCKGSATTTEVGVFPVIVQGYLLDIDDDHLYLSDDGQNIARAVKRQDYVAIEIVQQVTEMEEKLRNISVPEDRDNGH